jgi:hypothetical protein
MAAPAPTYQRLARGSSGGGGVTSTYHSLWLGADHLLLLSTTGYTEEYRRFYFRDIQVLYVEPTRWREHWAAIWGVAAFLLGLIVLMATEGAWGWVLFFTSPLLMLFGWNWALGPCCRTHVATAVQITRLPPLARVRQARKVLARLQPLILAAQADLAAPPSPETPAAPPAAEPMPAAASAPPVETPPAPAAESPPAA